MNRLRSCALALGVVPTFSGCSNTPLNPETAVPVSTAKPKPMAAPTFAGVSIKGVESLMGTTSALPEYLDPNNLLSRQRSVYFDYDDFSIKSEHVEVVERHGKYLMSKPALTIRIEGNAGQRGTMGHSR